jgi:hypothetical protein
VKILALVLCQDGAPLGVVWNFAKIGTGSKNEAGKIVAECFVRVKEERKRGLNGAKLGRAGIFAGIFGADAEIGEIAEHLPVLRV